jgi:DNA-binding transcriptional LysR family regulator
MSLFSYHIFEAVAKQQSFLRAAEVLNLTPSAISHSIASLESKFGFPLFIRSRSGVHLTKEGESLLIYIRSLLNCEEQLDQVIGEINGLEKGTVRIGAFNSVCANWIPDIIKSFLSIYPNININIMQGGYDDITSWLKSGNIDIGFSTLPIFDSLTVTPLNKDRLLCITPKTFNPRNPKYVTIDDIKDEHFIMQCDGNNIDTKIFIDKYNLSIHSQFYIEDDQSIIAMVESGLGISIVPELVLNKFYCDVNVFPLEPNEFRTIGLITNKKQSLSPATLKLYNHILSYMKSNNIMNV